MPIKKYTHNPYIMHKETTCNQKLPESNIELSPPLPRSCQLFYNSTKKINAYRPVEVKIPERALLNPQYLPNYVGPPSLDPIFLTDAVYKLTRHHQHITVERQRALTLINLIDQFIKDHGGIEAMLNTRANPAIDIKNIIYGVGTLMREQLFSPNNDEYTQIIHVASQLPNFIRNSQHDSAIISITLYSLNSIIQQKYSHNIINYEFILTLCNSILTLIEGSTAPAREISNTLYSLGKIAKRGILPTASEYRFVIHLAQLLIEHTEISTKKTCQDISNALLGLGYLANKGLLPSSTDYRFVLMLAERLLININNSDNPLGHLQQTIDSINIFIKTGLLPTEESTELLNKLCNQHEFFDKMQSRACYA